MAERKLPNPARRSQRSRQAILNAAADLLGEVSYTELAVEAIAARAGVGKQTIYRWWPDKGAVVLEAFLALINAEGAVTFPDSGDIEADLKQAIRPTVEQLAGQRFGAAYRALLTAIQGDAKLADELARRLVRPLLEATKDRLRAAQAVGQIGNVNLDLAVELLYGPLYYRWLLQIGTVSGEYSDAIVELAMRALRPQPGLEPGATRQPPARRTRRS